jgi:Zn-finger protein
MLKDDCGGNYKFTHGVKDCSGCTIPHGENSYEYIMSKMKDVIAIGSDFDGE